MSQKLFSGLYHQLWRDMTPDALTDAEVEFITSLLKEESKGNILDVMCGFGRHARKLAELGHTVQAIDESTTYIDELREFENYNLKVSLTDIRELEISREYDSIICMGNSIGSLTKSEQHDFIKKSFDSLRPQGFLLINSWMITEIIARRFQAKEWFQVRDITYMISNEYLFDPTRIESTHTLIHDDKVKETIFDTDYILSISEYYELFQNIGYTNIAVYSTPRKRKFKLGDEHCYIVAKKA